MYICTQIKIHVKIVLSKRVFLYRNINGDIYFVFCLLMVIVSLYYQFYNLNKCNVVNYNNILKITCITFDKILTVVRNFTSIKTISIYDRRNKNKCTTFKAVQIP